MWLINWKLHFLEWKTRSFALKFSPQNTENRIFRALKFRNFLGRNALRPLPPPPHLLIQSVTLSKLLATSIFIATPESLNDVALPYMEELLVCYRPTRTLRSVDKGHLVQPNYNLKTYGYRAFSHAAPKMWNFMPVSLRTSCELSAFKFKIKTFLFKHAFQL